MALPTLPKAVPPHPSALPASGAGRGPAYRWPLILVTSLFFLWGMAYGLLDVLNKHFQETLSITRTRSTLLQAAYFGAYFLLALPAGLLMSRYGYKKGILAGLLLYAGGAFLFFPAARQSSFAFFLVAIFVLASGLTFLETAANPYATVLGPPHSAAFRLNLAQCFNGVGSFLGPVIGAHLFFGAPGQQDGLASVQLVYLAIAGVVLVVAGLFFRTPLPDIQETSEGAGAEGGPLSLWRRRHFTGAVVAQFFYVAAQVGVAALFINYCTESGSGISNAQASYLLSLALLLFTAGRFAGTLLLRKIAAPVLLRLYAVINMILCGVVMIHAAWLSVYALIALFFFESIMFPTIFALGVSGLGPQTKKASSFLIMAIVGGALVPYAMGVVADSRSTAFSYSVPLLCFAVVAWYGWKGYQKSAGAVVPPEQPL